MAQGLAEAAPASELQCRSGQSGKGPTLAHIAQKSLLNQFPVVNLTARRVDQSQCYEFLSSLDVYMDSLPLTGSW
jgi:hypothetical protein